MIRIAQVVEAVEGGCRRHVLELACGLDPVRFRQTVIFSSHRDPGFARAIGEAGGHTVEAIPWDVRRDVRLGADLKAYCVLRRLLSEGRFDVVHCHSAKAGFLGRAAARNLPVARLYTPHCFPFRMRAGWPRRRGYLCAERLAGRYTDRLIAVAPSEAECAVRMGIVSPGRATCIENGIDPTSLDVTVDVEVKRRELGITPDAQVVLALGSLRPQKGYRHLVEAAPRVAEKHPGLCVLIAGEGGLRGELEELIARLGVGKHVQLLGLRADVPELLHIADCFVLPSLWEGGPYALLEAMAASCPVVGSRIDGITDWVTDGETGRLAEPGNPEGLAAAISRALSDAEGSRRMATAAKAMVLQRNTRERWLAEMAALYEEVAPAL